MKYTKYCFLRRTKKNGKKARNPSREETRDAPQLLHCPSVQVTNKHVVVPWLSFLADQRSAWEGITAAINQVNVTALVFISKRIPWMDKWAKKPRMEHWKTPSPIPLHCCCLQSSKNKFINFSNKILQLINKSCAPFPGEVRPLSPALETTTMSSFSLQRSDPRFCPRPSHSFS